MKKFFFALMGIIGLTACNGMKDDVPFHEMHNYFFQNDAAEPSEAKISDSATFESLFGAAALMGEDGQPTPIDFSKEFVIAVVNPVTDRATELVPESLQKVDGELVFTYTEKVGETQTWTSRPILLIKVSRSHDADKVRLVRKK